MSEPAKTSLHIIYLGGYGRSGSTILSILLAQDPLAFCLGEIGQFCDDAVFIKSSMPLGGDPRWRSLIDSREFEPFLSERQSKVKQWLSGSTLTLFLPQILSRQTSNRLEAQAHAFATASGIANPILIDVSKTARGMGRRAFSLCAAGSLDVRFIHIERNVRDVIAAVARFRHNPRRVSWPWFIKLRALSGWFCANLVARHFQRKHPERYLHISFESLLADPTATLERVAGFSGINLDKAIESISKHEPIEVPLMFGGNRVARNETVFFETHHERSKQNHVHAFCHNQC